VEMRSMELYRFYSNKYIKYIMCLAYVVTGLAIKAVVELLEAAPAAELTRLLSLRPVFCVCRK